MNILRLAALACLVCLLLVPAGVAQTITGSTTIDIDPDTGYGIAICQTDLDADTATYYQASVTCRVYADGTYIGSRSAVDTRRISGIAMAFFSFAGVPGTTYTAIGIHTANVLYTDDFGNDPATPTYFYDAYDFSSFETPPVETYLDTFDWVGPGPPVDLPSSFISTGQTEAYAIDLKISYSGQSTTLNGTTQSVVVGQQIALSASYTLPDGVTVQSQSWSVPGTTVGGYAASVSSGATMATNFSQPSTTYYWVDAGTARNVTYTLTLSDGSTWSASVPFNVSGPTSPTMPATLNPGGVTVDLVGDNVLLEFGNSITTFGIIFDPHVTQPSGVTGTLSYVQLINFEQEVITDTDPPANGTCTLGTGLDNNFPYIKRSDGTAADSPGFGLRPTYTEWVETFSATMYLMWNSGLPNSIPVPLGSMPWGFSGDAYRDLTSSIWSLRNTSDPSPTFTPGITYPQWSTHVTNGVTMCHPS